MDALQTLKELITIPIINPMPGKSGQAAERVAIDYLDSLLSREQIDCERQTAVPVGRASSLSPMPPEAGRIQVGYF